MPDTAERPIRAYFGHHKCASTWIMQVVARVALESGMRHLLVVDDATPHAVGPLRDRATLTDSETVFERSELRRHADETRADFVSCLSADQEQAVALRPFRAFHVIRDPRDIVVSGYFSHRNSHPIENLPHLVEHRRRLREVSLGDGLLLEMEYARTQLRQLDAWDYGNEAILEVKMEDLTADPYRQFLSIFRHLELLTDEEPVVAREQATIWTKRLVNRWARRRGLDLFRRRSPVTGELLLGNVYAARFEAQSGGRSLGTEDATNHYRKGVAGDWIGHFTVEHAEVFDREFGDLLVKLGYEADRDWIARRWSSKNGRGRVVSARTV